jgi:DnaJ-class molecular chaperone
MVEHYKSPIRLECRGCRGSGRVLPINVFEQHRKIFERNCDTCQGLGYVTYMADATREVKGKDNKFNFKKDKK